MGSWFRGTWPKGSLFRPVLCCPHYLLPQSLLHPSTPNRDYRPSTVANGSNSGTRLGPRPTPTPPGLPHLCHTGLGARCSRTKDGGGQENTGPHCWLAPRAGRGKLVSGRERPRSLPRLPLIRPAGSSLPLCLSHWCGFCCPQPAPPAPRAHLAPHIR